MNITKTLLIVFCLLAVLFTKAQDKLIAKNDRVAEVNYVPVNDDDKKIFTIYPAAVKKSAKVIIEAERDMWATLEVLDNNGEVILEQQMAVSKGSNSIPVFYVSKLDKGVYNIVLKIEDKVYFSKLVKE
jgi:hypothetical protein